ncbi:MAG: hypothetical protein H7252_00700 [Cytophaga sp.]|nr:hypothetical protein [Undibacterium sp.]
MFSNYDFVHFLRWLVGACVLGIIAVICFVFVIDPYRIYRWVDVPGFNHVKPQPDRYQEQIKLINARASKANAFIFGNSRAEIGLNPEFEGFASAGLSVYNLALSGTRVSVTKRELDFLKESGIKPEFVILGVEFLDYLVDPNDHVPLVSTSFTGKSRNVSDLKWQFDALFSLTSLTDSLKTLQIQKDTVAETISPRGLNPFLEYKKYVRQEGYYPIFQQRALEYARVFAHKPHGLLLNSSGTSPELEGLRAVLSQLATESKESHVIIYPYHAQILAMFEQAGLWPAFEQWKDLLVAEIDTINKRYSNVHLALWDFSGYSKFQCEVIPEKNNKLAITQWYWEAGHFKQAYGDLMLARLLETRLGKEVVNPIGVKLGVSTLLESQLRIQNEKTACMSNYPAVFNNSITLIKSEMMK